MKEQVDVEYWDETFAPVIRATLDPACLLVDVASLTNAEAVLLEAIISTIVDIASVVGLLSFLWTDPFIQVG